LAAGDALGTSVEFQAPGTFEPLTDIIGGGPFKLPAGAWTDDTSMALCLAESLVESAGFDPHDQMERYLRWYETGYWSSTGKCFDIGNTIYGALARYKVTGNPIAGSTDPEVAGNGSIMRLAAIPLFYGNDPRKAIEMSGQSSLTTHGSVITVDACRYMGGLIIGALRGTRKHELLEKKYAPVPNLWEAEPLTDRIDEVASGSFKTREPPTIQGTGYVVKSLEAALWCLHKTDNFRDGALLAANLGDDADTTAAVYGQIAGAYYGEQGIPENWRSILVYSDQIGRLADKLYEATVA